MNLYLLMQTKNNGYDTYDSCIVVATDEESAKKIHPSEHHGSGEWWLNTETFGPIGCWAPIDEVEATLIGTASPECKPGTVLCASFNAG